MKKQIKKTKPVSVSKPSKNSKTPLVVGAVALASLAGAYFLYGSKEAVKNRKQVKGWIVKAKGEIIEKLEKVKTESEEEYNSVVDAVLRKYKAVKSIDTKEVDSLSRDLKKHWKAFQQEIKKVKKS